MIHGPCGALNPNSPCMKSIGDSKKKICEKNYPMEFSKETKIHENAFPEYRRRSPEDGGRQHVMERGTVIDNRWIIPYNPVLLILTDSHVNVIKISSVISVKYAFKYVTKSSEKMCQGFSTNLELELLLIHKSASMYGPLQVTSGEVALTGSNS